MEHEEAAKGARVPDLQTQLEQMLDCVWQAEANWKLDDRIDLALKIRRRVRKPLS